MPTSRSISTARSRASFWLTFLWSLTCSAIWSPTVNTGFRLVSGSWKIIAISLPRILRISPSGSDRTSRPSNHTSLPAPISAGGMSSRRMIVMAVTLLPEPGLAHDAERLPARQRERDPVHGRHDAVHDLEVGLQVADVEEEVVGAGVPRVRGGRWTPRSCAGSRIERVAQAVTHEVHGQHRDDDRETREQRPPPVALGDELQAARQDVAPRGRLSGRRRTRGSSRTPPR